jgi:hypothetical protein
MIPLDDLLPKSDAGYEPPESVEFFDTGKPFWEFADVFKWPNAAEHRVGYEMACFDVALKMGRPFRFMTDVVPVEWLTKRAHDFQRSVIFESEKAVIIR